MPTWMNCYNGSTGSSKSANNAAKDLDLFSSSTTPGYNYDSGTIKSGNGLWEARCFGRAHSYSSSAGTYSYSIYVFAKKLNSVTSWGDSFKVVFYYRGKTYTASGLTRYLNGSGETRLISSHTFTGLSGSPSGTSTIGAKVTGEEDTEVYQTINLTGTANFNDDTWSVASKTDSSIKLSGTKIANRNFRHTRMWQYKKSSASSYTTDDTVNYVADNKGGTATHTFSSLSRDTAYDVRVQFRLRNYKPQNTSSDTEDGNYTVILSGLTWSKEVTTDKSDLSGSVSLGGSRQIGKTLTAEVTNTNSATLAYQWSLDSNSSFSSGDGTQTVLNGKTSSSLVVPTSALDKYIYCKVTFTKDGYNTKTIRKYTSDVAYRQPFSNAGSKVVISGTTTYGQKLTATVTTDSGGTKAYQWWYSSSSTATSGTNISGATSSTYTIGSGLAGKYIGVTVKIAASPTYEAGSVTDITSRTVSRKSISPTVTISGTNTYGQKLTASVTTDSDGTKSYQWYYTSTSGAASGTNISGATSSTYTINNSDTVGKYIGVKVTIAQGTNWLAGSATDTTNAVIAKRPFEQSSSKVTITGSNQMNGTLTASTSSGSSGTVSFQWWIATSPTATSGTKISGATSQTFKVTSSQIGKYIGVTATWTESPIYLSGSVSDITSGTAAEISPTVTAPTIKTDLTYAGSPLALANAGSTSHGTIYYYASTSSTTPSASSVLATSIPTGHPAAEGAAQTYHVWYKVVGNKGYTDVGVTKIGSVAVNPGTFTVTKVPFSGDYDGSAHRASIKVNLNGCTVQSGSASGVYSTTDTSSSEANAAITLGATSRTKAGTTPVYYQVSKNYYKTVTGSTTITINRIPLSGSVTISGTNTYGQKLTASVSTDSGGTKSYQWWYATSSTATSGTAISGATDSSYTIGSGMADKYIGVTVSIDQGTNYNAGTLTGITNSIVSRAKGSGSVTMSGWTYGGTVPNPIPSSSTNGTSNVSYKWYNSNQTELNAKPTSTSNAGIYYVQAIFAQATDYNAYTTDLVGFTVLPSVSISVSQDYLKGDYGVPSGTISYSLGGGIGSCTNITLTSNNVKIFDNVAIATSGSVHPKAKINTTISYSITYKDGAGASKTTTGSKTVSFPYDKTFDYTYSHMNASGTKITGITKGFVNDGTDSSKQFCLTATEWNDMNKFLYSAAFRKNNWSNSGLTAPKVNNATSAQLTATIYNNAVILAEKITGSTYNRVISGSRVAPEHLNGFRTIINNNR